ncbi:MAG: long-chain fatty acid--CoA ligase [Dehalococcoidia bacterium]
MSLNLGTILQASAHRTPDHVVMRLGEFAMTYAELDRAARGFAAAMCNRGIEPGDHVAIMIPNVPQFPVAYFGILYAGAAVVPLNVLLTADEVEYHIQDSGSKLLVGHPMFAAPGEEGARRAGVDVIWADGEGETVTTLATTDPVDGPYLTDADDTAVILYTSGTTGRPKGAELTHSNLLLNCKVVVPDMLPLGREDVALATLPLFHSFGQSCVMNAAIATGATFVLLPRFTPADALGLIQQHQVTFFAGVPTMYFAILGFADAGQYDASSLRLCVTGGAPMPVEVLIAFNKKYNVEILEGYGLSETSPIASFNRLDMPRNPGSIGYPVWGVEMAIMDESGAVVADGERGEIVIRGHNIMKGYYQRPDATREAIRGGWFHSGDIGVKSPEDGSYAIVDRLKDMILRGGFNVYPREVEEVLYQHPAVAEAAVLGIPDAEHGEEVKAVIALKAGQQATSEEIIAYCKEHVAAYKYPRIVEFLETLPKGPTGKILKREMR